MNHQQYTCAPSPRSYCHWSSTSPPEHPFLRENTVNHINEFGNFGWACLAFRGTLGREEERKWTEKWGGPLNLRHHLTVQGPKCHHQLMTKGRDHWRCLNFKLDKSLRGVRADMWVEPGRREENQVMSWLPSYFLQHLSTRHYFTLSKREKTKYNQKHWAANS